MNHRQYDALLAGRRFYLRHVGDPRREPFFAPDCLENLRTDAPADVSIVVLDQHGAPVCGRCIEGAARVVYVLEDWELCAT